MNNEDVKFVAPGLLEFPSLRRGIIYTWQKDTEIVGITFMERERIEVTNVIQSKVDPTKEFCRVRLRNNVRYTLNKDDLQQKLIEGVLKEGIR